MSPLANNNSCGKTNIRDFTIECTTYKKRLRWSTYAAHVNISWRTDARRARLLFGAWRQAYVWCAPTSATMHTVRKVEGEGTVHQRARDHLASTSSRSSHLILDLRRHVTCYDSSHWLVPTIFQKP
jgi:hypothetical protein